MRRPYLLHEFKASICAAIILCCMFLFASCSSDTYIYESPDLGFRVRVPRDVEIVEIEDGIALIHGPSAKADGSRGELGVIVRISPRSRYLTEAYDPAQYMLISMGRDCAYVFRGHQGGVDVGEDTLDAYLTTSVRLSSDYFRENFIPDAPDSIPQPNYEPHFSYLTGEGDRIRPDDNLTRGELAEVLYTLLVADNKTEIYETSCSDVRETQYEQAVGYLESYGIIIGYPDDTFRPEQAVSRAEFAVSLHRFLFMPASDWYGAGMSFTDMPAIPGSHWAVNAVESAWELGWMTGYPDNTFRPEGVISRAEAVTVINRILGRDESSTSVQAGTNPFRDLPEDHWGYGNILEASGALVCDRYGIVDQSGRRQPPDGTSVTYYLNDLEGWGVRQADAGQELCGTTDGGETWDLLYGLFPFNVSSVFFFDSQNGVVTGTGKTSKCAHYPYMYITEDGGRTWSDCFSTESRIKKFLPTTNMPNESTMYEQIRSIRLRLINSDAVYIVVTFEKISGRMEGQKQTVLDLSDYG